MRARFVPGYLVAAAVVMHAALLVVMSPGLERSVASKLVQFTVVVLATVAVLVAARRRQGPLRRMWELVGVSFFFWAVGHALFTYFRATNLESMPLAVIIDLPYFAFYLPLFATLFLGTDCTQRGICWPRTLDLAQLGIVLSSSALYFALFLAGAAPDRAAAWVMGIGAAYNVANVSLWGLLLFRTLYAAGEARRVYVQLLTFFTLYAAGDSLFSYVVSEQQTMQGSWYDLLYTIPFAYAGLVSCLRPARSAAAAEPRYGRRDATVDYVLASLPPLAVLFLGVHISRGNTQLGLTVICGSFLCYMARLWITQHEEYKALRRLDSSERRFRAMVEKSNEAVALMDGNGKILYLTEPAGSVLGTTPAGHEGTSAFDSIHPEDLPRVNRDMMRVLLTLGGTARGEYRAKHADGTWRWLECVGTNLLDDADVGALVVNYRDVTERRQAELALRQSEQKFSKAFHCSLYPLAITRLADGRVVDVNELLLRRLNCTRERAIGCSSAELGLWAKPEQYQAMVDQVRSEGSVLRSEVAIQPDGGEPILALISAERIEVEGEECVLWVAQDITQRKKAEEALQRSEARFRHLFENANDVLFTLDAKGNFTSLNRKGAEVSGYGCGEGERMNFEQVVAPEYRGLARRMIERAMAGEAPPPFELEFVTREGERVWLEVSGRGLVEKGEARGVQAIARDITERRTLEHQLRQSQKMEAVGLLAGGLAHDFNNLLAVILGYTDLLGDDAPAAGKNERALQHIRRAADRAATLTRQLLAFSRKQVMQPRVLDLNSVALDMSKLLVRLIGEHIVQTTRLNPKLGKVKADPAQVEQVLMNLAVNARDAMPNGGQLIIETDNVEFAESDSRPAEIPAGKYAMLAVHDTGVGMEPEVQARIFEPFFTTKEPGKSTGLGLAMVYGIVKQSGAHIAVESERGKGTAVRIYLPLVPTESATTVDRPEGGANPKPPAGSETILLVEDEASLRGLIAEYLTECGYAIVAAGDGNEALRLAQSHHGPIHMLVTDVVMPGMSGPELAQKLSKTHPAAKRVYISGYNDSPLLREELLGDGVTFIHKPIRPVELARRLRSVLDAGETGDEQPLVDSYVASLRN